MPDVILPPKSKRGIPVPLVLILVFIITLTLVAANAALRRRVNDSEQAADSLLRLQGLSYHLSALEWQSIARGQMSPEIVDDVKNTLNEMDRITGELEQFDPKSENIQAVRQAFTAYVSSANEEFKLIAAGDLEQARIVDEEQVDPAFNVFEQTLSTTSAASIANTTQIKQTGDLGSALALFVNTVLIALAFWRFQKGQQAIEREHLDELKAINMELEANQKNLEQRVAERITDIEIARQQSENRARELQSIGEISKVITSEQKLETLLPLITRLVSERFGFYHTGIFLIDETNQFAVLQAANSAGGKNMLARGHRLEVGGSGIVGYVAKFGTPRISLDVGLDAVFFNNPDLPNTRSEMALPLKVRDQTIGVLDVQSENPGAFTENDTNTLSILADQIAIALENARLFTKTQQALSEAQALNRQSSQAGWLAFSHEEVSIGYQQNLKGGRKLTAPVESDEIRQAMNRGDVLVFNKDGGAQESSIVVPIKLRGQIIGALNIKAPTKNRRWSNDEVNLAEAISERLALALENARLIQDSQRQALKEQTISEVTGKIGASINLKNVLQTAVEELGRAMPGSEVILQFQNEIENKSKK